MPFDYSGKGVNWCFFFSLTSLKALINNTKIFNKEYFATEFKLQKKSKKESKKTCFRSTKQRVFVSYWQLLISAFEHFCNLILSKKKNRRSSPHNKQIINCYTRWGQSSWNFQSDKPIRSTFCNVSEGSHRIKRAYYCSNVKFIKCCSLKSVFRACCGKHRWLHVYYCL